MATHLWELKQAIEDAEGWLRDAEADAEEFAFADEPPRIVWPEMNAIMIRLGEIKAELKTILAPIQKQMDEEQKELDYLGDQADAMSY